MDETKMIRAGEVEEDSIELWPLFQALLRRWWLIALVTAVFGVGTFMGTIAFVTPTYRSSFTAYVNNRTDATEAQATVSNSDLSASRYLTYTYAEIIRSRAVLETAAEQVGLDASYSELSGMVSVSITSDTEIIKVNVTSESPATCQTYAQAIAEVAVDEVASIVEGSSMRIIDDPVYPTGIASPNYAKNAVVGALLGFLLAAAVIVLRAVLDDRIRDEETLESRFGIPILGTIPNAASASSVGGNYYTYGYGKRPDKGGEK